ncbi:uncharacterized protein LOC134837174 [Culicoides brevitarsis]|uniref:uncharacterized protein LOC134837174 n=1 Tax=Culicoides brevitarsis TaxID=469753 RepID=UPI00307C3F5B
MAENQGKDMQIDLNFSFTMQIQNLNLRSPVRVSFNNARCSVNRPSPSSNRHSGASHPYRRRTHQQQHRGPQTPPTPAPAEQSQPVFDLYKLAKSMKELNPGQVIVAHAFLDFCSNEMGEQSNEILPMEKRGSIEWKAAIKGRITEKFIHSAQRSGTRENDFLLSKIVGYAARVTRSETSDTRALKVKVLNTIRELWTTPDHRIKECGLYIRSDFPVFSATVDAISDLYVYKIITTDSMDMYKRINSGKFNEAEINEWNFIMHITKRKKMYIFVVHPQYPRTKVVNTISIEYDSANANETITDAMNFWERYVFPIVIRG